MRDLTPDRALKEALDRQTEYLTFLPEMGDGFHIGYHSVPGVVHDHNKRPAEWLESMARCMRTTGGDVGFSIPDVLAGEQQLRRLSRLSPEEMLGHQQMCDYRAVLSMLLLWDTWPKDDTWPVLELHCLSGRSTAFTASVTAALAPSRAADGLWVFTLRDPRAAEGDMRPVALLSRRMAVTPAADPGDLSALLPPCVTWYDRAHGRFLDPCAHLDERDAYCLLMRLRLLQSLNEHAEYQSPLYSADAALCSLLARFAQDVVDARTPWRSAIARADEDALFSLRTRLLAVYAPQDRRDAMGIGMQRIAAADLIPASNPLLRVLLGANLPDPPADAAVFFTHKGVPFARLSQEMLLEPMRTAGEEQALQALAQEMALLERYDADWPRAAAQALRSIPLHSRSGLYAGMPALLDQWAQQLDAVPATAGRTLTVDFPMQQSPAALLSLLHDLIGLEDEQVLCNAFSDVLVLFDAPPYDDDALNDLCRVSLPQGDRYVLPPLSPALCQWLTGREELLDALAPRLHLPDLRLSCDNGHVTVEMPIVRHADRVVLRRVYQLGDTAQTGAAVVLPAAQAPRITLWPDVRFAPGVWKQYFLHAANPGDIDVCALHSGGWVTGDRYARGDTSWRTVCADRFPAFVVLQKGALSLGALVNDRPRRVLKHEPSAAVAVDFGSIATTVMMRQGERLQPASLPQCLHRTLLCGAALPDCLTDTFLPEDALLPGGRGEVTAYSLMDLFLDDPQRWTAVLRSGHIYYPAGLQDMLQKSAADLYYDLKWGEEDYARSCLRLFLKQTMVQASLSARLWGSPDLSWRVSMPGAMPLPRQEAYLETMRGLAREVAAETGLPLTGGVPAVLYTSENQADGLYFLGRSEVNAAGGYLNMDIGGGTVDLSLWLGGASHAALETSLMLGCRQMLFESLCDRHPDALLGDLAHAPEPLRAAAQRVCDAMRVESASVRGRRKCMLLLDDLFAAYAPQLRQTMADHRANGRITYLESLLLFHIGYLFCLAGDMLHRAWQDDALRPLLPPRMELCIAGNGGQLLKVFSDEQLTRLCSLTLSRLNDGHPLRILLPIQSSHPKQEVARGLLANDGALSSALQVRDRRNGTQPRALPSVDLLREYLHLFYHTFPQAAHRLMPQAFEEDSSVALTSTAAMELDTIFANEAPKTPGDDAAAYVRCLHALKVLWHI